MLSGGKWTWRVGHCDDRKARARCFLCKHEWDEDLSRREPGEFLRHLEDWLECPSCGSTSANYFVVPPINPPPTA
jgi:hypothetical protein